MQRESESFSEKTHFLWESFHVRTAVQCHGDDTALLIFFHLNRFRCILQDEDCEEAVIFLFARICLVVLE